MAAFRDEGHMIVANKPLRLGKVYRPGKLPCPVQHARRTTALGLERVVTVPCANIEERLALDRTPRKERVGILLEHVEVCETVNPLGYVE